MKSLFLAAVLSQVFIGQAFAGPITSGGGAGIICRSNIGFTAYSLDLYEGRVRYRLNIDPFVNTDDPKLQLERTINRIKDIDLKFYQKLKDTLKYINENLVVLSDHVGMNVPLDVGTDFPPLLPMSETDNCSLMAAAYWGIDNKIYLSKEIILRMNRIDQTSVYLHEALYKMARDTSGAKDSFRTRKMVAYLLSENSLADVKDEFIYFIK